MRAGGDGGDRGWNGWDDITDSVSMSLSKLWEVVKDREAWCAVVHGVTKSRTQLSDRMTQLSDRTTTALILLCLILLWTNLSIILFPNDNVLIYAATAKSRQSCPTLFDPIDGSPPGSSVPGILQARTLEWVAISFSNAWKWKVKVNSLSCLTLRDPMDWSPPGSSVHVHGIFQARVLEWGAIAFPNWSMLLYFKKYQIYNVALTRFFYFQRYSLKKNHCK